MTEPLTTFESFSEAIAKGIAELGWTKPMPVQQQVIPVMREERDVLVQAVTGSGKTGAFGLPIIERIDTNLKKIQAMVLAPTRELAGQISKEINLMGKHVDVEAFPIYGGTAYNPQLEAFERGAQVIIGTPGRILDHLKSKRMKLDSLRMLIFDEADELLSLGFWPDMKELRRYVPEKRQTGLFSATIPERVKSLTRFFLTDPAFISLTEGGVRSPEEIEHYHIIVPAQEKDQALLRILEFENPDSAIIFCNTRDDVRFVSAFLRRNQIDADMIQGDMTQGAREKVMARIKAGELRYLVATDVAARGIDISDLSHVISYATPDSPETYLHRTGRTGRAGKTGTAISLISGLDIGNFRSLQAINRMTIPERPLPKPQEVEQRVAARVEVTLEHALRELPEREQQTRRQAYVAVAKKLASTDEGLGLLSSVLFEHLRATPQADEVAPTSEATPSPDEVDESRPRRRRRRRRPSGKD